MSDRTRQDAAASAEWLPLSESLLRGLVHSLNNRLTALAAFSELASLGDDDFTAEHLLSGELTRLQEVGALFRLLVRDDGADEAMELAPVIAEALALHAHHAALRVVHCTVEQTGTRATVRAPRWALLRLLLTLLESGKRIALEAGRDVTVLHVSANDEWITLRPDTSELSPYAVAMARLCGSPDDQAGAIRLPTLLELRRRERMNRGAAPG